MKKLFHTGFGENESAIFLFQNKTTEKVTQKVETVERTTTFDKDVQGSIDNNASEGNNSVSEKQADVNKAKEDATKKGTVESMLVFLKLVIELMKMLKAQKGKKGQEALKEKGAAGKEANSLTPPPVSTDPSINTELEPLRAQHSSLMASADTYDASKDQVNTDQKKYDDFVAKEQVIRNDVLAPFVTKKEGLEKEFKNLSNIPEKDRTSDELKKLVKVQEELIDVNAQIKVAEDQIKALNIPEEKAKLDEAKKTQAENYKNYIKQRDQYIDASQVAFANLLGPVGDILAL